MTGHICDRCGKFYQKNKVKDENGRYIRTMALVNVKSVLCNKWDLCDDCLKGVIDYMNYKNGINEDKAYEGKYLAKEVPEEDDPE